MTSELTLEQRLEIAEKCVRACSQRLEQAEAHAKLLEDSDLRLTMVIQERDSAKRGFSNMANTIHCLTGQILELEKKVESLEAKAELWRDREALA